MTLKVIIRPAISEGVSYPVYYTEDDGVYVGPSGELHLTAGSNEETGEPNEFRIYAPGTWKEVNVEQIND